ncbi:MAG: hypothetical protein JRN21_09845 [Nitrososphaerota archaeon]|nr:hypothetical protein [Nitrososphaerota archaeon]
MTYDPPLDLTDDAIAIPPASPGDEKDNTQGASEELGMSETPHQRREDLVLPAESFKALLLTVVPPDTHPGSKQEIGKFRRPNK